MLQDALSEVHLLTHSEAGSRRRLSCLLTVVDSGDIPALAVVGTASLCAAQPADGGGEEHFDPLRTPADDGGALLLAGRELSHS